MAKPAFDPSKPFQVISKPAFDPSKPFTVLGSEPPIEEPGLGEKIETGARSAFEGLTLGASEPVISGINAVVGNLIDAGFDADTIGEFAKKAASSSAIEQQYKKDVERRRKLEAEIPQVAIPSEIAGAIAPGFISGGAATIAAGLPKLGIAAGEIAAKAVPTALGKAVAKGAISAAASEGLKQAVEVPTGFIKPEEALPLSAAGELGGEISGGLAAIPMIGRGISKAFPKVLSAIGGVKENVISDYLKRKVPVENLSFEQLKAETDKAIRQVQESLGEQKKQITDDVITAVGALKDKLINGSQEALNILEQQGAQDPAKVISGNAILQEINKQISAQKSGAKGATYLNAVREAAGNALDDLKTRLEPLIAENEGKVDLVTAKEIIKSLDEVTDYQTRAGTFSPRLDQSLQQIRRSIDQEVKNLSPEYKQKMLEVADDAKLLGEVTKAFGDPQSALSNIESLIANKKPIVKELAQALEKKTGIQFTKGVQAVQETGGVRALKPETSEGFLKSVMGDRSIENKKTLGLLSELSDIDLNSMAERAALTQEFSKIVQNGSRDVNFWKELMGGTLGTAALGPVGGAVGAGVGYLVKTFGAPATKTILDGMIKVKGLPTVAKLNNALSEVDPQIRQNLIQGFIRSNVIKAEADPMREIQLDAQTAENLKKEVIQSDMNSLQKAKALRSLAEKQSIQADILRKHMLGVLPKKPVFIPTQSKEELKIDKPDVLKALQSRGGR